MADLFVAEESMKLPQGFTCDDCLSLSFCQKLIGNVSGNETCDWAPSRFRLNPERVAMLIASAEKRGAEKAQEATRQLENAAAEALDALAGLGREGAEDWDFEEKCPGGFDLCGNQLCEMVGCWSDKLTALRSAIQTVEQLAGGGK